MDLKLNNNQHLTVSTFPDSIKAKITTVYIKDCREITENAFSFLNSIMSLQESVTPKLSRIRVDIGARGSYSDLMKFSNLQGFDDDYNFQAKPRFVGSYYIDSWHTIEQLNNARSIFESADFTISNDSTKLINFDDLAVQTLDSTKPNYNPAVAIILQQKNFGVTLDTPVVSGQTGRWFMTKAQAASAVWPTDANGGDVLFRDRTSVSDTEHIVSDTEQTYTSWDFLEFKYFTGVTSLPTNFCRNSSTHNIVLPTSLTIIKDCLLFGCANVFVEIPSTNLTQLAAAYFLAGGSNKKAHFWQTVKPTVGSTNHPPFENTTGNNAVYVGVGSKLKCIAALESWRTPFGRASVKSWYDYAAPQITYDGIQVTMSVGRASTIYYTTDGTTPTTNSTMYTAPFNWDGSGAIKAMAIDTTNIIGDIAYADDFYAQTVETPVIYCDTSTKKIRISCATTGATIYYTTDGSCPDYTADVYLDLIDTNLEDIVKIRCFADKPGMNHSEVASKMCVMDDSLWGTDGDTSNFAVQCMDSTKPNYNPAVCIILDNRSKLTDSCRSAGGYISKDDAAAITAMWTRSSGQFQDLWFQAKETVTDSNKLVTDEVIGYDFEEFDELKYFTQITLNIADGSMRGFFYNCKKLKYVTIPDNATMLYCTFWGCTKLERVTGVDHLTSIGICAFNGCGSLVLNQSDINPNIQAIGPQAFCNCSKITINTIPAQITNIAENVVRMNTFTGTTSIPYLHFLSETPITGIMCSYARIHIYNSFNRTTYKIYVGDGTSAAHDDAILADYQAAANWSGMVSDLDTWYNYLHPQS